MDKIIQTLIDSWTKGVDTYTHNGSTWLIFTESKQWVIELTNYKTLWYNYNFFKQIFEFTSLDVVENQSYITKWVEDNIINKELTYATLFRDARDRKQQFEDALENGVRHTEDMVTNIFVDDTLENGVKETITSENRSRLTAENIIENGVKRTQDNPFSMITNVENTIQNGVKVTNHVDVMKFFDNKMEDALENGVKDIQSNPYENKSWIEGVIKGGVKETRLEQNITEGEVGEIIENGVKETVECDWNIPKSVINDVISEGVKSSVPRQYVGRDIIDKVIDKGVIETHDDVYHHKGRIDGVIKNGVKETKTPGKYGDIMSTVEWMKENNSTSYPKMIDDVIENGVKEIRPSGCVDKKTGIFHYRIQEQVDDVVDNGEKVNGTYAGGQRQSIKCKSVVEYGTKNPTD